ncbi:citrate lyase subunit beta / citryl-CoA lyase [Tistlia consotensis]|uniref:Citrate lyase subunit beta / citryl-CoA lyase n=1 Tax=Tistlia consotensis USBA 355 TaxID=560819 RepID=A0A1Y6BHD5_9PROT|nr:CoA ester lyase [Tistlia consotensis]SMF10128.1 citrate lyase subunit beta / citryl-CoA lyase [Tistlia consotensis USBA 355]SNR33963.1 citrate lyase subunit beta / citryl-CoA lyase [Tistlia consotensis]
MATTARPRRSMLYMPGSNTRALDKGRSLPADGLILDLEDAVAPDAKAAARENIVAAVAAGGYGRRELVVRVNGLETAWGRDDVAALATSGADAILLPKVESAAMVQELERLLAAAGAPADLSIMCMMETPRGILKAEEIAAASTRLSCLVMGTSDLVKDLDAVHTPDRLPVLTALSLCVLAARAHGLAIVDGVHLDLSDDEGFAAHCRQGRALGFDGKTLIHPKTIAKANEVFGPSEAQIAEARRIIEAHGAAVAAGKGVVVLDGKLVENLHVEAARRTVAQAEAIAALEAGAAG